jgi:mRNA interferase HigB
VRIISRRKLQDFWILHTDSEQALKSWYGEVKVEIWQKPVDVQWSFPRVRIIGRDRLIFPIKGNRYRLVVAVNYESQIVFIRFIGTHAEYDKIDALSI